MAGLERKRRRSVGLIDGDEKKILETKARWIEIYPPRDVFRPKIGVDSGRIRDH